MKCIYLSLLLLFVSHSGHAIPDDPARKWLEDIDFYGEQIKAKHIRPFHTLSESVFDSMIVKLKVDLPSLSEAEVETRLMKITSAIGDGHTNYALMSGPHKHYPLRFRFFEERLMITASSTKYSHLVGSELISINGAGVSELYSLISDYLPSVDNQYSKKVRFEFYLTLEKLLRGLGITKEGQAATLITQKKGIDTSTEVTTVSMHKFSGVKSPFKVNIANTKWVDIDLQGIDLGIINGNTAYFRFTRYPSKQDMTEKCSKIQRSLKTSEASKLIVDFRGNGGGNLYSGLAFSECIEPLEQFNWLNGAAILIDSHTFSAAMVNTIQFKQFFNATVIGEPTGGDPNAFSEGFRFELPNSGRKVSVSIRYYSFLELESDAVYPDETVHTSWENFQNGVDSVLLKALETLEE